MTMHVEPGQLIGHRVLDNDGNSVGKIGQVFYDDDTDVAKWVTVRTGLFGNRESFVPLQGAGTVGDDVQVPYGKQEIKDAPHFDVGQHISEDEERQIYEHYNAPYPGVPEPRGSAEEMRTEEDQGRHEGSGAGATTSGTEAGAETGAGAEETSVTRSEEQVHVGAERTEGARVRLRKHVDTEEFQETVPVTHEEITVEREPVEGSEASDTRMEDEEQEITLHEERATVSKESVPVERVRVRKHDVTEEQQVRGERRKERVELEEEDGEQPE
ncbi:DUF2382 domain-containing protein [Streptomonospora algeriensis]|uniref:DUF2382 domain-containing protein n=1 Tax=Streptomonospora algeriensis TaxID=995084 RepID=A0ABW3BCN0_9ACTN